MCEDVEINSCEDLIAYIEDASLEELIVLREDIIEKVYGDSNGDE